MDVFLTVLTVAYFFNFRA